MSKGRNRERQNFWDTQAQQANQQITQVDPLEQRFRDQQMAFLNWKDSPGRDVRDAPGLSDYIQIGQSAQAKANQERMGTGALQLGSPGAEGYTANLKQLHQSQQAEDFGTGLENALAARNAEATGSVMPLAQLTTNRNIARAGNATQMFGQWNQRQSKNWWDYLTDSVRMGSQIAGAFGGGGG